MKISFDKPVQPIEKESGEKERLKFVATWVAKTFDTAPVDQQQEIIDQYFSIRDGAITVRGFSFEGFDAPLPDGLQVLGDFDIRYTTFTTLPEGLHVTGDVYAQGARASVIAQLQVLKSNGSIEGVVLFNHKEGAL